MTPAGDRHATRRRPDRAGAEQLRSFVREPYDGRRRSTWCRSRIDDGIVRIVTDLPDVPAEVIAFLHEYRWTIEVFFRFFKQVLGCRHLLSHKPEGVLIQAYCAIIACLLLNLWTGKKPLVEVMLLQIAQ